jgi:hypothetical protein
MLLTTSVVSLLSYTTAIMALMEHQVNDILLPDTINETDYQIKPGSNRIPLEGELPANIAKIQTNSDTNGVSMARKKREVHPEKPQGVAPGKPREAPEELHVTVGGTVSCRSPHSFHASKTNKRSSQR